MANVEIAMESSKSVKVYKAESTRDQAQNDMPTTLVGKVTVEKKNFILCTYHNFPAINTSEINHNLHRKNNKLSKKSWYAYY